MIYLMIGESMAPFHTKNKIRFHKYLYYLFFCIIAIMILSFTLGILDGIEMKDDALFFLLILLDISFLILGIVLMHKISFLFPSYNLVSPTNNKNSHAMIEYDTKTGLLYKDSFFEELRKVLAENIPLGCLAITQIEVLEFLQRSIEHRKLNQILNEISKTLQSIEGAKSICGCKSNSEFWIFLYGTKKEEMLRVLDFTLSKLESIIQAFTETKNSSYIRCGYSWFPTQAVTYNALSNNTDYALYEALIFKKKNRHEFSFESYHKQEMEYKRNALFDQILEKKQITYYLQPIIRAKDASIYGYEALMRTTSSNKMTPLEILDIAKKQNRLYELENYTLFHVMKIISQNTWAVRDKKIFVNSIPNHELNQEDFDKLYHEYANYLNQIVIEITENEIQTEQSMEQIHKYLRLIGGELALDDYGSGYANEANLLKNNPNYIKIDRTLIQDIDQELKKQHLVTNIILYAKQYNITCLAEGVETFEELQTVIHLGVDLIQGYYVGKPTKEFLEFVPSRVKDDIIGININIHSNLSISKTYDSKTFPQISLIDVALNGFTSILVHQNNMTIVGEKDHEVCMSVYIEDNSATTLTLKNVNMKGNNAPAITIGNHCQVQLIIEGVNTLTYEGIRVPESSKLSLLGDGDLTVNADHNNSVCIGGNYEESYGSIISSMTGTLNILSNGDYSIGMGGCNTNTASELKITSGIVNVEVTGDYAIGFGSREGTARINISGCKLNLNSSGTNVVGIGSLYGNVSIEMACDLVMDVSAGTCIGIGSSSVESFGDILFHLGHYDITIKSMHGAAIGSNDGNLDITFAYGEVSIYGEGTFLCGIGNYNGAGKIHILSVAIKVRLLASKAITMGSTKGDLIIEGGNIDCQLSPMITAYSPYHEPLTYYYIESSDSITDLISSEYGTYRYEGYESSMITGLHVYLPNHVTVPLYQ